MAEKLMRDTWINQYLMNVDEELPIYRIRRLSDLEKADGKRSVSYLLTFEDNNGGDCHSPNRVSDRNDEYANISERVQEIELFKKEKNNIIPPIDTTTHLTRRDIQTQTSCTIVQNQKNKPSVPTVSKSTQTPADNQFQHLLTDDNILSILMSLKYCQNPKCVISNVRKKLSFSPMDKLKNGRNTYNKKTSLRSTLYGANDIHREIKQKSIYTYINKKLRDEISDMTLKNSLLLQEIATHPLLIK